MTAENAGHALATVLVDELVRCGVHHACVSPGSRSTPVALALAGHPGIATRVVVDERSSAFCALGIGKATGVPAAVLCTSGTAVANLLPAVIEAHQSRTPMLLLTADRPPELRHTGANQTIDQLKIFGDAVRLFVEVGVPEAHPGSVRYWRSTACQAWAAATGSPAGPVQLNLAFRDPLVPVADAAGFPLPLDGRAGGEPWTRISRAPAAPDAALTARLAGEIAASERGLLVAGGGIAPSPALVDLAERAGWPVLADPLSGLRSGPHAVSAYEALLRTPAFARAMTPDLVVRVGALGTSKALAAALHPGVRQVRIDPDAAWEDPERAAGELIVADLQATAGALAGAVRPGPANGSGKIRGETWLDAWMKAEAAAVAAIDAVLDAETAPSEPRVARDTAAACPDGAVLVAASSMPVRDLEWFMRPRTGLRVLANRGASGIDGFAATALGVALGTGVPVVALAGDLSMLHDRNGLALAREHPPAVFVVVNNDGGGIFSFLPQAEHPEHFERLFGTPQGIDVAGMAREARCAYGLVDEPAALCPAIGEALAGGGVHLLEVRTNREANVALHRRVWAAVAAAVAG
ncbi:MAG TPA: 2-succinyl-5-enolpyruvyl-6-hydroxy-3-cyclohexene-1-carboxylic-acid synthase [Actinomycetota bacterium]|nr:2-succinyl-5-enolpyruvyl-6-hydroxy-3-cyclohexene-1-carboxylic-acid synthase [Actinomycetota bacterium]